MKVFFASIFRGMPLTFLARSIFEAAEEGRSERAGVHACVRGGEGEKEEMEEGGRDDDVSPFLSY